MANSHETECSHCGGTLVESPYPRHSIILQDESDAGENRRIEGCLCPTCWDEEFATLARTSGERHPDPTQNEATDERERVSQHD